MARYTLAVISDGQPMKSAEAFTAELKSSGRLVFCCGLTSPDEAVAVTPEGQLGDGPVRADDLQLNGFWVVDAANRSEALALAVRAAGACGCQVEVRELAF